MTHPAAAVAQQVAAAGWGVVPIRVDTDDRTPTMRWSVEALTDPDEIDLRWPRWAAVCGSRGRNGHALVCLDADSPAAVVKARRLLPGHCRVRTGRGEHAWVTVGPYAPEAVRSRFYLDADQALDWRGGQCIALLPGSLYAPIADPQQVYTQIDGPPIWHASQVPAPLLAVIARRAPAERARARASRGGDADVIDPDDPDSAYSRFLAAAEKAGREVRVVGAGRAYVSCPTDRHPHGNRRPALWVTAREDGSVGLWCFARQCAAEEIVAALELTLADLMPPVPTDIEITENEEEQ